MSEEIKQEPKDTLCFTYEVTMVVQILATDKDEADMKLDRDGGYVSKRTVVFKDKVALYSGNAEASAEEQEEASEEK